MNFLRKLLGHDDKFFNLLEASAVEAQGSVRLLVQLLREPDKAPSIEQFISTRRKEKRIKEEIRDELCKTFVTPLEREDIEALSLALYKIPKTVEKFSEKYLLCREQVRTFDLSRQTAIVEQATETVLEMVRKLRSRAHLETAKDHTARLQALENEADRIMMDLVRELYSGRHEPLKVIILLDLCGTLEKIIDRCRDAGNVVFQIVLKYS